MTAAALKALLSTPWALLGLMFLASFSNGLAQIGVISQTGKPPTCSEYFFRHWPETFTVVTSNLIAFIILVLTDQLNYASALGVGFGLNSLADLLPKGKRAYDLKSIPDDPSKVKSDPVPPQQGK